MAKLFLFVVLFVIVECHPQPPDYLDASEFNITPTECSDDFENVFNDLIEKSKCSPKEVLVHLRPPTRYEEVNPGAVMLKRCVGICTYETFQDDTCIPTKIVKKTLNLRVFNEKTSASRCVEYTVEEHEECSCNCKVNRDSKQCRADFIQLSRRAHFRKCNIEERRKCLQKRKFRPNLHWNKTKCTCERRRRRVQ